jgi:hypothetical protein
VTERKITNLPASIRQRLLQIAQTSNRPFQELVQYYAMERLLYRLSVYNHADKFVLKGALMLAAWGTGATRPTRDIDLLGYLPNRVDELVSVIREVCGQDVEPDALIFDTESVAGLGIKEDADYEGVRITFQGSLQNMRIPMQVDVGFGDTVFPVPTMIDYPTILKHAVPHLRGYSRETTVAEKFEAMVKLGLFNSRMKDFYDIWLLSRQFAFDGSSLATAVEKTFAHRGTPVTAEPTAFSPAFATDPSKMTQWRGFLSRSRLDAPADLAEVTAVIAGFLSPPALAIQDGHSFPQAWPTGGPWIKLPRSGSES